MWVGESEDGGPKERVRIELGVHQKVIIAVVIVTSVAVTGISMLLVDLILLLVDPIDGVLAVIR